MSATDPRWEREVLDQTRQQLLMTLGDLADLQGRLDQLPPVVPEAAEQTEEAGR